MEAKETGGPAFPKAGLDPWGAAKSVETGMTLRDYFAAKAMQGWTANPLPNDSSIQDVAAWAYRQADAMLEARTK
ncbi:hypothetical protein ACX1DW_01495 [Stutzerimonas sp. KH-1]